MSTLANRVAPVCLAAVLAATAAAADPIVRLAPGNVGITEVEVTGTGTVPVFRFVLDVEEVFGRMGPGALEIASIPTSERIDSIMLNARIRNDTGVAWKAFRLEGPPGRDLSDVFVESTAFTWASASCCTVARIVLSQGVVRPGETFLFGGIWTRDTLTPFTLTQEPVPVPEPASLLLFGLGLAGTGLRRALRQSCRMR